MPSESTEERDEAIHSVLSDIAVDLCEIAKTIRLNGRFGARAAYQIEAHAIRIGKISKVLRTRKNEG